MKTNNSNFNPPVISVILPVYNGQVYLRESINSILNQTFTNFELIIINDGSKDQSEKIIKSYKDIRIKHISRPNKGLPITLNEGISLANGKYIARQDQDDISKSDRFEKQVKFLMHNDEYYYVGTNAIEIDENGCEIRHKSMNTNWEIIVKYLPITPQFIHPSVMFRREFFDICGLYNVNYYDNEDMELWFRSVLFNLKGTNLTENLLLYRVEKTFYNKRRNVRLANSEYKVRKLYLKKLQYPRYYYLLLIVTFVFRLLPEKIIRIGYDYLRPLVLRR